MSEPVVTHYLRDVQMTDPGYYKWHEVRGWRERLLNLWHGRPNTFARRTGREFEAKLVTTTVVPEHIVVGEMPPARLYDGTDHPLADTVAILRVPRSVTISWQRVTKVEGLHDWTWPRGAQP